MKKALVLILSLTLSVIVFSILIFGATASSAVGYVSISSGNINVRAAASTYSEILDILPKGAPVTLMSKSGNFWLVEYDAGKYGYCYAPYITVGTSKPMTVSTSGSNLNVRAGAGVGYAKIGSIANNKTVLVTSSNGAWSHIVYDGTGMGYVSSAYLSSASAASYQSISLSLPSYKQYDSRWSSIRIGSSASQTIGNIGCTVTSFAMDESYRTGRSITPATVAYEYSFTSGGALYWPGNYASYYPASPAEFIYNKLLSGKPVIVQGKNSYGTSHFVIVKGFSGSGLSYSNFTINDPGSETRKTLADFFAAYPNFTKAVCY